MSEQRVHTLDLDPLFPESDYPVRVRGTAGEILEKIADEWGLEDDVGAEPDLAPDGAYPSVRAVRAHQMIEDHMGKPGAFSDPDSLLDAMVKEGLTRQLTDDEFESLLDEEEVEEYEEARQELDEEWRDGVWET